MLWINGCIDVRQTLILGSASDDAARSNATTFDTIDESASTDTTPRTPQTLIFFILEKYHATHRRELAELGGLARKVEVVHATHAAARHSLAAFLVAMLGEREEHMSKEEQMLFPTLLSDGGGCAPFAMRRMRMEHEGHERHLDAS